MLVVFHCNYLRGTYRWRLKRSRNGLKTITINATNDFVVSLIFYSWIHYKEIHSIYCLKTINKATQYGIPILKNKNNN